MELVALDCFVGFPTIRLYPKLQVLHLFYAVNVAATWSSLSSYDGVTQDENTIIEILLICAN